jgi:hypothetical protein
MKTMLIAALFVTMLLAMPAARAAGAGDPALDVAAEMQDLERSWQQVNAHEGRCLEFESPEVEAEFHVKFWRLRKEFLGHLAEKSDIGLLYATTEWALQMWLMAEYGNPGCLSGTGWQPTPDWPNQRAGSVNLTVCDPVSMECGDWTFTGLSGHAHWKSGAESTLTVDPPSGDDIVIHRTDTSGPTAGLTATYKGSRVYHIFSGDYVTSWPGHDNAKDVKKQGDWEAKFEMKAAE